VFTDSFAAPAPSVGELCFSSVAFESGRVDAFLASFATDARRESAIKFALCRASLFDLARRCDSIKRVGQEQTNWKLASDVVLTAGNLPTALVRCLQQSLAGNRSLIMTDVMC